MKEGTVKFSRDAGAPGINSPIGDELRSVMVAAHGNQTNLFKKLALVAVVAFFAAGSLIGCQSAQEQASATEAAKTKTNTSSNNNTTPKSSWPKTVTIPSGTTLHVSLDQSLSTDGNKSGESFKAHLYEAVRVNDMTILPSGTEIRGGLTHVEPPHRTTGKAQMTLVFDQVVDPSGQLHSISTSPIVLVAEGDKISDEEKVAAGAVIGGVIGAISSSKQRAKGAAVGAAAGAAAGGAIALATKGHQIELPAGQHFAIGLDESIRMSVTQQTASR